MLPDDDVRSFGFPQARAGLERGDFSLMEPLFGSDQAGNPALIVQWHEDGLFAGAPAALAEAHTCACFLGKTEVAEYLLKAGSRRLAQGVPG